MRQLSGMDAAFVYLDTPTVPMHFGGINLYDPSTAPVGRVGYEEFLQHIASRLHLAPSARERVAFVPLNLDHPYWISDPNFDLEYHVRHVALPKPGDWTQLMRWEAFCPLSQVHPEAPPFFVVHGRHDSLLFFEDARYFVETLRKTSRQHVVHAELPHAQHGFELLHTVRASAVVDGVVRYLEYIRATQRNTEANQGERHAAG